MYTTKVPLISTPTEYLRVLQQLSVPASEILTKELLRGHVLSHAYATHQVHTEGETGLYASVLSDIGVQLFEQRDEYAPAPARVTPTSIRIPQFDTRWCYEDITGRPGARSLNDRAIDIALLLSRMGLGRLFARVCVSDDISAVANREQLPDAGFDALMSVCFPVSGGGVEVPVLLVQYTPTDEHLEATLFHEAMHVVIYYLWGLRAPQAGGLFPLYVLVSQLASEIFAQRQTAAVFGTRYVMGLLNPAARGAGGPQRGVLPGPRRHVRPTHGSEAAFQQTMLFFETLPWVLALEDFPLLAHLRSQLMLARTPGQHQAHNSLAVAARELFAACNLTDELHGQLLAPLDVDGPCGQEFATYSANLWAFGTHS
jgi:hypothetical protein